MGRPATRALLSALLAASPAGAAAGRAAETGFLDRSVVVSGISYRYQVFVPAGWSPRRRWPVILFLHGVGERGDDGVRQTDVGLPHEIRRRAADFPVVVVMPQCRGGSTWRDPTMLAQALAALDRSVREFRGDPARVYATGLSMGGYGVWELASRVPGRFAAYVPVCGGVRATKSYPEIRVGLANDPAVADPYAELARRVGRTPTWIFHGGADPVVPVDEARRMRAALAAAGADARYTEYPGVGHGSWVNAYAEPGLVPWLFAQRRPQKK